jgi:hypothetical protein
MSIFMFLRKLVVGAVFVTPVSIYLLSAPIRIEAQAISGDLVGVVTDPSGAVMSVQKLKPPILLLE